MKKTENVDFTFNLEQTGTGFCILQRIPGLLNLEVRRKINLTIQDLIKRFDPRFVRHFISLYVAQNRRLF